MATDTFQDQFNLAIDKKDWPNVIELGEAYIAQFGPSPEVVYNLGLAYMETGHNQMAVALFLALAKNGVRSDEHQKALEAALLKSGRSLADVDMGAHGLTAIISQTVNQMDRVKLEGYAALVLPVLLAVVLFRWFGFKHFSVVKRHRIRSLLNVLIISLGTVMTVLFLLMALSFIYKPNWCAVVSEEPAVVRSKAASDSLSVTALVAGTPVLVLGGTSTPWLYMLESSGAHGWVDALQVRCVVAKK
jgi:hypothetical protein